jgi:hypothetical protein
MNPMNGMGNETCNEQRPFLRFARYVLLLLAVLLYVGVTDVQVSAAQTRKVTLVSYAGFTSGIQVQTIDNQSRSWALRHTIISSERGSVDIPTSDPIRVYFQKLEANVRLNTFHTEIVDVPGDVCFKVEGTLASPNVSRCDESVGVMGPDVRQVRFQNDAWYDAQMSVTYYEDQTIGGNTKPMPKSIETGFINGLGGKYRLVNLPASVSLKMPIVILLQGSTTVRDSVWASTIPANFTGNPVPCYKVWGTVLSPQGGACNDTPVAVPPTPPSAPTITSVNGESVSPAAQLERDCYNLVQDKVAYDTEGHTAWSPGNIVNLCKGTTNPQATISCFNTEMPRSGWSAASKFCSLNSGAVDRVMPNTAPPPTSPRIPSAASGPAMMRGQAHDIDAKNGQVWIVGIKGVDMGWAILKFDGTGWVEIDGSARRIAIDGQGTPWVINATGGILRRQNGVWVEVPGLRDAPARDIAITNSGEVWIVTTGGSISRYTGSGWTSPQGMNATRIDYFANTDTLQLVDTAGKRWTRESATSWVMGRDPSGLAGSYADYAVDNDGTRWAIDDGYNIWKLGPTGQQASGIQGETELRPAALIVSAAPRTITFRNEGGFNSRLMVVYSEVGPGGFPLTKILTTGELMLGQSKSLVIPDSAPNQMITVQLIGTSTTNDNFFSTKLDAGFTGDRCFKSWGTLFSPQGGACK